MIWAPEWAPKESDESALVSEISRQILSACDSASGVGPAQARELAHAVACFVERECGGYFAGPGHLAALASRALASLGEGGVARRLVVFGSGMAAPSEWVVSGEASMWVLDLRRMTLRDAAPLELLLFRSLDLVIETVVPAWDATSGRGVLGLRHVTATAGALLGKAAGPRGVGDLAGEIKEHCRRRVSATGRVRGWAYEPFVMDLDL